MSFIRLDAAHTQNTLQHLGERQYCMSVLLHSVSQLSQRVLLMVLVDKNSGTFKRIGVAEILFDVWNKNDALRCRAPETDRVPVEDGGGSNLPSEGFVDGYHHVRLI